VSSLVSFGLSLNSTGANFLEFDFSQSLQSQNMPKSIRRVGSESSLRTLARAQAQQQPSTAMPEVPPSPVSSRRQAVSPETSPGIVEKSGYFHTIPDLRSHQSPRDAALFQLEGGLASQSPRQELPSLPGEPLRKVVSAPATNPPPPIPLEFNPRFLLKGTTSVQGKGLAEGVYYTKGENGENIMYPRSEEETQAEKVSKELADSVIDVRTELQNLLGSINSNSFFARIGSKHSKDKDRIVQKLGEFANILNKSSIEGGNLKQILQEIKEVFIAFKEQVGANSPLVSLKISKLAQKIEELDSNIELDKAGAKTVSHEQKVVEGLKPRHWKSQDTSERLVHSGVLPDAQGNYRAQ
jgi:hypothetical protein